MAIGPHPVPIAGMFGLIPVMPFPALWVKLFA